MRRDPDFYGDQELVLIYVAKRLKEALALEQLLTEHGVDYLVEPDTYTGGVIFRTARTGAFFYVAEDVQQIAVQLLSRSGYRPIEDSLEG